MRYGSTGFSLRTALIRLFARLQKKPVVILNGDPKLCGEILAASNTKGSFLEFLIATPAWNPIYSIESMDGERWEQLSADFKKLLAQIGWREKLPDLLEKQLERLRSDEKKIIDAETISRLTLNVLFEILFETEISTEDEYLFYEASLEWRKEIAVKGKANHEIKRRFWPRLNEIVARSRFHKGLESYKADPSCWLSLFAQPFILSPQINFSDIVVSIFHFLRADEKWIPQAKKWAMENDRARLDGIILEAIRLKHPFPILEREMKTDFHSGPVHYRAGTQIFILLDEFKGDPAFDPERWLAPPTGNPYHAIPFAAGPRMCVGKPIAMELLTGLLRGFLLGFDPSRIQPNDGHLFSGRDNDGSEGFSEVLYQIKIFSRGLWRSFLLGRRSKSIAAGKCPFGHSRR